MKRIISVVLIVIMVTSLVACSGERVGDDQDVSTAIGVEGEAEFVSDWKEGEKNKVGNTSWNLNSLDCVTEQGNWVYYFVNDELCKEDREGNKYVLASQIRGRDIQIIGDWIYFYNLQEDVISKIKTDGSELVTGYPCEKFYVTESGIIYVTKKQTSASTYKIELSVCDLDFENSQKVFQDDKKDKDWSVQIEFIGMYSNRLYFSCCYYISEGYGDYRYNSKGLYYVDLDKREVYNVPNLDLEKWINRDTDYVMIDNYIYFLYDYKPNTPGRCICKFEVEKSQEVMSKRLSYRIMALGLIDNNIYGKEEKRLVMRSDGGIWLTDESGLLSGERIQITEDYAYHGIALTHKYIYYSFRDFEKDDITMYRIDYSGENWEEVGTYTSY